MKERPTIKQSRETPSYVWTSKREVTIPNNPNKKLNLDTDVFIHVSYKKHRSPIKFIFNSNCESYICISQVKREP